MRIVANDKKILSSRSQRQGNSYAPEGHCVRATPLDCLSFTISTNDRQVQGIVRLFWAGQKIHEERQLFKSQEAQKYQVSDGKLLNGTLPQSCAGETCCFFQTYFFCDQILSMLFQTLVLMVTLAFIAVYSRLL